MGVVVSSSHVVSAAPSSSLFPCSSVGFHPREIILHKLPQHGSFLQEQSAPAWGSQVLPANLLRHGSPMGSQVLAGACSSTGSPQGHSLLRARPAPAWGFPWAVGGDLLPRGPPWLQGQPASPWSAPWATGEPVLWHLKHLLPSFCIDFGVCRVVSLA